MHASVSPRSKKSAFPAALVNTIKRAFIRPIHAALIFVGVFVLLFSLLGHAYPTYGNASSSDGIAVTLSTHDLALQPGTELPVNVQVHIPPYPDASIPVSFEVNHPPEITIDGELQSTNAWFSLNRDLRIGARLGSEEGIYPVTLRVHTRVEGHSYVHSETIVVKIGTKSRITFLTSPNTTLAPSLSNVAFSQTLVDMSRNEKTAVVVSFVHHGSSTDYIIRFAEFPIGIKAYIANASHHFVDDGQVVTSTIELTSLPSTAFDTFPLYLEAYDVISGEKTQLGTVLVRVNSVANITASVPFHEYSVGKGDVISTYLTITNTEYGNQDVIIESTSTLVVPQSHQVNVPSKSSVSIPVQIYGNDQLGARAEQLFVLNANASESVPLVVRTVPAPIVSNPNQNQSSDDPLIPTGLVSGVISPLVGGVIFVLAMLIIFSKGFRNSLLNRLPKPAQPPKVVKPAKEAGPHHLPIEPRAVKAENPSTEPVNTSGNLVELPKK